MENENEYWYAVYTKPRWEKKVSKELQNQGIIHYAPLNKVEKQWTDRKKIIYEPVFKSYVFIKIAENKKWDLKKINGILNFVHWLGKPAIIKEVEIETIKKFLNEYTQVEVGFIDIKENSSVSVKQGLLMDYKGQVKEIKGNKVVVYIQCMGIMLQANIDKSNLELINTGIAIK